MGNFWSAVERAVCVADTPFVLWSTYEVFHGARRSCVRPFVGAPALRDGCWRWRLPRNFTAGLFWLYRSCVAGAVALSVESERFCGSPIASVYVMPRGSKLFPGLANRSAAYAKPLISEAPNLQEKVLQLN